MPISKYQQSRILKIYLSTPDREYETLEDFNNFLRLEKEKERDELSFEEIPEEMYDLYIPLSDRLRTMNDVFQ